jgi:hypothetical protein
MPIFRGKNFVSANSDFKDSVRVASRSNINLDDTTDAIDEVSLVTRDRVLLAGQSNSAENGIYVWLGITKKLVRAPDADSSIEVGSGMRVYVEEGTHNGQSNFVLTTPGAISLGVTPITFRKENRIGNYDFTGTYGSTSQTLIVSLDDSGQITNINSTDIQIDGGSF